MPLDIDYVAGKAALEDLKKLLDSIPYGERQSIADDILDFREKMENKHKLKKDESESDD